MTTKIEWTDETWNPVTGCSKVSQGCHFCYAERLWPKVEGSRVKREGGAPRAFTDVRCHPERLDAPLRWRTPRRIFVNSMSDLFHEDVPDSFIDRTWAVMLASERHTFQILTKRPYRMLRYFDQPGALRKRLADALDHIGELGIAEGLTGGWRSPLPKHIWLGVSVEDQATADERIPLLLRIPAAIRFVSYEPALGPIELDQRWYPHDSGRGCENRECEEYGALGIDWLIAGGESGPNARPSHPDWFRSVRDQCTDAGVAFFFKQWGEWVSLSEVEGKGQHHYFDNGAGVRRVGKKAAGRLLDGREHNEYPA